MRGLPVNSLDLKRRLTEEVSLGLWPNIELPGFGQPVSQALKATTATAAGIYTVNVLRRWGHNT